MKTISTVEFEHNTHDYLDVALREPVAITRNGRESCVLLSTDEFKRLMRRDRKVFHVDTMSDEQRQEMINLVSQSEMPAGHEHVDELLKDWEP